MTTLRPFPASVIVTIALLASDASFASAQNALSVESVNIASGQAAVSVPIRLENDRDYTLLAFTIGFDASLCNLLVDPAALSIASTGRATVAVAEDPIDCSTGKVRVALMDAQGQVVVSSGPEAPIVNFQLGNIRVDAATGVHSISVDGDVSAHEGPVKVSVTSTPGTLTLDRCADEPLGGCLQLSKAMLQILDDADDDDRLSWRWRGGEEAAAPNLGDPTKSAQYSLCLYDSIRGASSLATAIAVPPGAAWRDKTPKGYQYSDRSLVLHGVRKLQLKVAAGSRSKLQLKARGANLPLSEPVTPSRFFAMDSTVTVQLTNDDGTCWTSIFDADATKKHDGTRFKARTQSSLP